MEMMNFTVIKKQLSINCIFKACLQDRKLGGASKLGKKKNNEESKPSNTKE
jgi:hypothetical protein